jgi:signal transduction histidine kinase
VLGDPTLVVRYPARDGYVDEHGRAVTGVGAGADRLVTPIRRGEREIAAVVHDRALPAGPELLEDAAGALSVALANAQMQAEVRDRVAAVEASRRRLVTAAEAERRRFGHRLRQATEAHLDAAERELAGDALADLRKVRADIRLIAEGLDPLELAAGGLDRALSDLATRSTIPVAVDVRAGRLPPRIESGAWFVCSEALANVAKHSGASRAFIRVAKRDGLVRVEISDDGRGGADSARGSGLHGLADRVEALGGRLSVTERSRGGTSVVAELPVS